MSSPYTQAGLIDGTTCYFVVTAVNSAGESAASSQVSATPQAQSLPPSAPTGVAALAGSAQVTVSWNPVSGATSYNIYWSTSGGVTVATGTQILGATSPYVQSGLTAGATYYYVVTAVNANGESTASSPVSATPALPNSPPPPPTGVVATAGHSQNFISFSPVAGATSYNLYWSTTSSVTKATGTAIDGVTSPYSHTGLADGTTYYYVVTAANAYGESTESAQIAATTVTTLTSGLSNAVGLAVDSTSVYWADQSFSSVYKVGVDGGTATTLASTGAGLQGIALDSTSVYFTVGSVYKVGINGGTVTTLASSPSPGAITVDSTSVYWADGSGAIYKAGIDGGTAATLVSGLYPPGQIAVDPTSVYWIEYGNGSTIGTINKVSISGGTLTTLASGLNDPIGIAVDSTSVYWSESGSGTVKKVGIDGGTVTTLASGTCPWFITIDSTSVYWTGCGAVRKVGLDGGAVTTLALGLDDPNNIAVDSTSVYWDEAGSGPLAGVGYGIISKLPK